MTADDRPTADPPDDPDRDRIEDVLAYLRGDSDPDDDDPTDSYRPGPTLSRPDGNADFSTDDPAGATLVPGGPGRAVGPFQILGRIAGGGMGEVFKARHRALDRVVAVKTIKDKYAGSRTARQRFRKEGEAVARLDHPNVVRIFEFGETADGPYYAMEYAEGGSLAGTLAAGPLPPREAAGLVRALAVGMAYSHARGVLHRDLKPNNVLLAADGTPKVADFGLARRLDDPSTRMTADGSVIGTPAYMAPEQAAGRIEQVDARTDVYALGAILYETLTGQPPFDGDTPVETLRRVQHTPLLRPSTVRPGLPKDLEDICLRCLEKDRDDRYQSAAALADDLKRYMNGEPLADKPWAWPRLAVRAVRRHRAAVAAGAVMLLAGAGAVWALAPRPPVPPTDEEKALAKAEADRKALDAELASGQPVVLIGKTGGPRFGYTSRNSTHLTKADTDPAGVFTVSGSGLAVVELVPDPMYDSFRLRAEILHRVGDPYGCVGVYVGDVDFPGPGFGSNGWHAALTYNDWFSTADHYAHGGPELAAQATKFANTPNMTNLWLHSRGQSKPGTTWENKAQLESGAPFTPAYQFADWRVLELEVTPAAVRGKRNGKLVGEITAEKTAEVVNMWMRDAAEYFPSPRWERCPPVHRPRGAIGIHLLKSSAQVRNVVLTPLPRP